MYVMKDIAHRGCINSPEYCSPQAFSARSFLDSTVTCDVTGILAENAFTRPLSPRLCADNGSRENALGLGCLILRTGLTDHETLFNQWEGALVFIKTQIKPSPFPAVIAPVIKNFHNSGLSWDRISHRFEAPRHIFKTFHEAHTIFF